MYSCTISKGRKEVSAVELNFLGKEGISINMPSKIGINRQEIKSAYNIVTGVPKRLAHVITKEDNIFC